MLWLDDYERRARLAPALLALLPIAIVAIAMGFRDLPIVTGIFSAMVTVGGPVVLANLVRTQGRALQQKLFAKWDGEPTVQLLRVGPATDAQRYQRREQVSRLFGQQLPNGDDEATNGEAADARYRAAVDRLRELTRDQARFPLVFAENRNYGFERNLLAVRPVGLILSCAGSIALLVGILLVANDITSLRFSDVLVGFVAVLTIGAFWVWYPNEARVRAAGDVYAQRLLDAATSVAHSHS